MKALEYPSVHGSVSMTSAIQGSTPPSPVRGRKINLHLDDGVTVNYGKSGDLLAEVKPVTGGREEE